MRIILEDKERWITFASKEAKMQKNGFKSVKPLSCTFLSPYNSMFNLKTSEVLWFSKPRGNQHS